MTFTRDLAILAVFGGGWTAAKHFIVEPLRAGRRARTSRRALNR